MQECLKVAVCGDSQVGKTSIVKRFASTPADGPVFSRAQHPTLGTEFFIRTIKGIKLQVWDTAGQERFRQHIPGYVMNARVILFVFDVNNLASFQSIDSTWSQNAVKWNENETLVFLVGAQCDRGGGEQRVNVQDVVQYAESNHMRGYFECSAKTGDGVDDIFNAIVGELIGGKEVAVEEEEHMQFDLDMDEEEEEEENGRTRSLLSLVKCCK